MSFDDSPSSSSPQIDFRHALLPSLAGRIAIAGGEARAETTEAASTSSTSNNHPIHLSANKSIDAEYYAKCLLGGGLSSSARWALTPFDYIKCSMQANPTRFPSFSAGLSLVWKEQGLSGLYRGFAPTVLAYFSQSGVKYSVYELIKDNLSSTLGEEQATRYKSLVYVVSAGSAEAIADVFMCPWEMLKVKVQTSVPGSFPARFRPALFSMVRERHALNFPFGSLTPLWSRQVIGTVANFVTFEHTVNAVYGHVLNAKPRDEYGKPTQLAVSFAAGYVSGVVSTVVSHPADSLLSLRARYPDKSYRQIIDHVGWKRLATQGLIPRAALTGTIIASQWFLYDSFKTVLGLRTSGGGASSSSSVAASSSTSNQPGAFASGTTMQQGN
mmetsp:Transcript_27686/g.59162  ORF Transcript_27686/g.59162 Transcript_27686/m.59162 type:complete len:385 (-) Transcript_27686:116-1270(-)